MQNRDFRQDFRKPTATRKAVSEKSGPRPPGPGPGSPGPGSRVPDPFFSIMIIIEKKGSGTRDPGPGDPGPGPGGLGPDFSETAFRVAVGFRKSCLKSLFCTRNPNFYFAPVVQNSILPRNPNLIPNRITIFFFKQSIFLLFYE